MVPGFTDAHLHFLAYGISLARSTWPVLQRWTRRWRASLARSRDASRSMAPRPRLGSHLWGDGDFPTRQDLDRVTADHPVFLPRKCGHAGWANSRALALAGITADTPDPYGGTIERDPLTGQPTGILKELAMDLMFRLFQEPTLEEAAAAIRAAMSHAHRAGLVGVHTMEGAGAFRAFQQLQAAGDLKLRVLMQIPEDNLDAAIQAGLRSGFGNESAAHRRRQDFSRMARWVLARLTCWSRLKESRPTTASR